MNTKKGQASLIAGVISSLATAATVIAGVFAIENITTLVQVIIGNLFYMLIISIVFIGGIVFVYMAKQGRVTTRGALAGFLILLAAGLTAPVVGLQINDATQSYQADITVGTTEPVNGPISFDSLSVSNVQEESGNQLVITEQEACIAGFYCGDWTVQTTIECGGQSKQVSISGQGDETVTKTVKDLPSSSQCTITGNMVRPENHVGLENAVRSFTTG